jgi:selenium metabolism protein YedF
MKKVAVVRTVDARGQACPQPVILAQKALLESSDLLVIVDNDTAQTNVSRMAEKAGCRVEVERKEDGVYLHIARTKASAGEEAKARRALVFLVASNVLGSGDDQLGDILIRGWFHTLNEVEPLPTTIIFINSGVRLVAHGSQVLEDLRALSDKGVEMLSCGTCLGFYGLKDQVAVGQVSNMYSIAETLLRADQVISL